LTVNLAFYVRQDFTKLRRLVDALRLVRDMRVTTDSALGALLCAAELTSHAAGDRSEAARAAWLFGAVQTVLDSLGTRMEDNPEHPYGHEYAASRERVRRSLGDSDYAAAFAEGRAASSEQAITRALAELEAPPGE
jgi:hypothetical protein